jgi:type II secretory pathway pseudopilin PulG
MPFDPNWPPTNAEVESAPFRNQFNSLKALIDDLQSQVAAQLAALAPQLARDGGGNWTLTFTGAPVTDWQVWWRNDSNPNWDVTTHVDTASFPQTDAVMSPGGTWWQVMICGENVPGTRITAFSNAISFGPVPT